MSQTPLSQAARNDSIAVSSFEISKTDLTQIRTVTATLRPDDLKPGEILLKVDSFAFTANNITYAELGDRMAYWAFFPTGDAAAWGNIPVWGFADVIASEAEGIAVDERIYGYFPMATHIVMQPAKVTDNAFVDVTPHRTKLPSAYNHYMRVTSDPSFSEAFEAYQALLRPLFITSFLIDDFLADENFFGADTVVISSASAKTAFGLAHQLHKRKNIPVIGLTSSGNRGFVESLGCYDSVVTYDALASLPQQKAIYVDFAGSADLRRAVHEHYRDQLTYSCAVGLSHRELNPPGGKSLPGAKPIFFFAPDRIVKRNKDWGRGGLDMKLAAAWTDVMPLLQRCLHIHRGNGAAAVEAVYRQTLAGKVKPDEGHMLSLWD